ncbi:MAG: hypothetical protein ACOC6Q_01960 [Patescibacteria group bacterium]
MIKKSFFGKILISTIFTGFLFLVTTRTVSAQPVYDLEITCDPDPATECEVSPVDTAPVFSDSSFPENDLKPGDEFTRQIQVTNNREETCYFTIDSFSVTQDTEAETGVKFSEELFTEFSSDTDSTGEVRFANLFSSTPLYLGEISEGVQEVFDWRVRLDESAGNEFQNSNLEFDFDWTFQCAEKPSEPVLYIEKTNSELGVTQSPGDSVVYTITVTAPDYPVFNVVVIDLSPGGFYYRSGSWTATSTLRDDLAVLGVTLEPDYESPGTWQLGDMSANETVTLTYVADISEDQESGIYPDIAWAVGDAKDDPESADVLANEDSGYFVGTDVEVALEEESPDADVEVDEEETEVLGAATGLPATGADNIWVKIVLGMFGLGVFFVLLGVVKSKKVLGVIIFGLVFLMTPSVAHAQSVVVRLQEPESPTSRDSRKLNFVALDTQDREITVRCFQSKPGVLGFSEFDSRNLDAGGDSGYCQVSSDVLSTAGTYNFYVEATADGDTASSEEVQLEYDPNDPDDPEYIEKESEGCQDLIEIKVGDDGDTSRIRVYRSEDTEFEANFDTEIRNIAVEPGEKVEFSASRPDCDDTYYYAVIAYDEAGNRSGAVAEEIEKEVTVTVEEEGEEEVAGAEVVAVEESQVVSSAVEGEDEDVVVEESTVEEEAVDDEEAREEEEEEGEVAGVEVEEEQEEQEEQEKAEQIGGRGAFSNFLSRGGWILLVLGALGVGYLAKRFMENK